MPSSPPRLLELDFLRGLVMLVIVVDHVGGSILSRFTLHAYAFNDAAEVFVFLGGYAATSAYVSISARRGAQAARHRFAKRAGTIYRAFVLTAGSMLAISAVFYALQIDAPNLASRDVRDLFDAPAQTLIEVASFRRQPYLASVLPMYVGFALCTPLIVPLARRAPWLLFAASVAVWILATAAIGWLPAIDGTRWKFNPLAWQFVFTLGALARAQPIYQRIRAWRLARVVSAIALAAVLGFAWAKLDGTSGMQTYAFKPDLGWLRVVNFIAMAWLAADMARHGWIGQLARRLPWINAVGRDALASFVAGAAISLIVDSVLYALTDGLLHVPLGLAADATAIAALFAVTQTRVRRANCAAAATTTA